MPRDDLRAVQREAYIHSPSHLAIIHTLEIRHPSFTQPLRVVRDQRQLTARLEADAPVDAGALVDFTPFWFNLIPPPITEDPDPTFKIKIDNVSGAVTEYLELAAGSNSPIKCTYRAFTWDFSIDALANDSLPSAEPLHMEVFQADESSRAVTFTVTMVPIANLPFPREKYTPDRFPGLTA